MTVSGLILLGEVIRYRLRDLKADNGFELLTPLRKSSVRFRIEGTARDWPYVALRGIADEMGLRMADFVSPTATLVYGVLAIRPCKQLIF